MVVTEKASSVTSSSSLRRKEKQSVSCQKESHGLLLKEKLTRKASSLSCSSPSRKERKNSSSPNDTHDLLSKEKVTRRASSFSCSSPSSSSKKERKATSSQNDAHDLHPKEKRIRKSSSFSSSPPSSSSTKREKKDTQLLKEKKPETRRSTLVKSRLREMGPICKRRKEILQEFPVSVQVIEEDVDVSLDKQIRDQEGKTNPDDCYWLSSGSFSPQEFGLFMSTLDPGLDEWVISFLPSRTPKSGEVVQKPVLKEEEEAIATEVEADSSVECSHQNITHDSSSSFWNMDRTGAWVSLINLEAEDSKWLSDVDSQLEELESDFPSPNWDSYSSDVGLSSSNRSTQENSQSEWSSELLSDSMDWELDSDDPIFWPLGVDFDEDQGWDSFSVSPRKGKEGFAPVSIRFRLHAKKDSSKEGLRRKILLVSGLSASKIMEFKKGCRKNAAVAGMGNRFNSKIAKRAGRFKRRVPPILENVLEEGKSPKTPEAKLPSDKLSESSDWDDEMEMDSDGPLVWPSDQKNDWDEKWDCFNPSPRKGTTSPGSPKGGFFVSSSVRLRFCPKKEKLNTSGLSASKGSKFKPGPQKTNVVASRRRVKIAAMPLRLSKSSCKSIVVLVPSTKKSVFRSTELKRRSCRTNVGHGKRIRSGMPSRFGSKSLQDLMRLVSTVGKKDEFCDVESTNKDLPIETVMGLNEFDGHEGVEPEFEGESFLLEDCMRE